MPKQPVTGNGLPKPGGHYSLGVTTNGERLVFTSGQVAGDPATGKAVEGGVREQTRQVLLNVKSILEAAGSGMEQVVKTTCFLTDIANFAAFNEVYREFFPTDPPARSTIQVGLVPGWLVEIEAVAVIPE